MRDLTRSFRPKDWESIIGQEALVKTLKNEIKTNTVGHAYLFCGPRGTGKTTTGRVFASYLDAQVIELDGASNNGVDSIRSLRDDVLYLPADGKKYKVYIIDEVHMLTSGAFNAFLKTLEEPPQHVIFILATTDPQKIPTTILSRCQRFDLRRIGIDDIVGRLSFICQSENISLDSENAKEVLEYIARQVDGGMRDAIKLLQKCTSLDEVVTIQTVVDALGSVNEVHLETMKNALINKDIKQVITYFNQLVKDGIDIKIFLADLVEYIKDGMTTNICEGNYSISSSITIADTLLDVLASLRNSTQIKTVVEIALIKLCVKAVNEPKVVNVTNVVNVEEKTAPTKKEIEEVLQSIPADPDLLKQVMDKLTLIEKRMTVNEMNLDAIKFKR